MSSNSIRRTDILALSNLRHDGRKPHEIRRMRIQMGALQQHDNGNAAGSALVEMGLTVALAAVSGPTACVRRADERPDRAVLQVAIKAAPFASAAQRVVASQADRRLLEASHLLQRALEACILLHLYPNSRIVVQVTILADDGGRLCAAINAATLAVMDAGIPMKDFLCACAAGYASASSASGGGGTNDYDDDDAVPLVDLNRREEMASAAGAGAAVNMPCAMLPQRGTVVLSQCEARVPNLQSMEKVMQAAMEGCRAVFTYMQAAIQEQAAMQFNAQNGRATVTQSFTPVAVVVAEDV